MNQLLITNLNFNTADIDNSDEISISYTPTKATISKKHFLYKSQFYIYGFAIFSIATFYFLYLYNLDEKEKLSSNILDNYSVSSLYNTYGSTSNAINVNNYSSMPINLLGIISIEKLDLTYPIFNDFEDDLLRIAPCRFYGQTPDNAGNLCIAAHNYDNDKFFSKINTLDIGDTVVITDQFDTVHTYEVFDNYEVSSTDFSPIHTPTFEYELTLITCNNINQKRIIVKAKKQEL